MMKKLLQIDTCLGVGSTGRITESIARLALSQGWNSYIVHGARYVKRPSCMTDIQTVSIVGEYKHYLSGLLFDNHGLASSSATRKAIEQIEQIKPDVIQLHCIHGYYLNYKLLFEYLRTTNIPVVWTFHDCWAFTGHCAYFDQVECNKWMTGCKAPCPAKRNYPKSILLDRSKRNYELKRSLFTSIEKRLTVVPVSFWLETFVKQSFLKNASIKTIHNGINLEVFKPMVSDQLRVRLGIGSKKVILGVALPWVPRKGMKDMLELAGRLPGNEYQIILVGLDDKQMETVPMNVIGVKRTNSTEELAEYYSMASVFVNPTYEDNFPTTNLEALACGTPVITYNTGGSPEAIDEETGMVVEQGDVTGLCEAVKVMCKAVNETNIRKKCAERAIKLYDSNKAYNQYLELYNNLLNVGKNTDIQTVWGGVILWLKVSDEWLKGKDCCHLINSAWSRERRVAA